SERSRRTTSSREVALEGLRLVREEDAYANLVLPRLLRTHRLSGRDAAFTTELFYGTLRAQGRLDAVLAACVDRPLDEVDPALLDVLRLGAHQLLDMSVAPHAATSETVALARSRVGAGAASFANAVLRRVGEQDLDSWLARVAPDRGTDPRGHLAVVHSRARVCSDAAIVANAGLRRVGEQDLDSWLARVAPDRGTDPSGHLAVVHSHPRWVVRALGDALAGHGRSRDEIDELLAAQNAAPA